MKTQTEALDHASMRQYCRVVRTPAIAANFIPLAEQAAKEQHTHIRYLEALLAMECEERDRHAIAHRIRDAQLPRLKTLEDFDFSKAPQIPAAKIRQLAEGGYIERSEPVVLIGDCGTGKSHLGYRALFGCVPSEAAGALRHRCRTGERIGGGQAEWPGAAADAALEEVRPDRFGRGRLCATGRHWRGVPVSGDRRAGGTGRVDRHHQLPFSEWTTVFPNPRLCKALLDRVTDRAHIIETGTESFRFKRTMEARKQK